MAAVGSVWARPSTTLRILGELAAVTAELPNRVAGIALGLGARLGSALVRGTTLRRSYLGPLFEKSSVLSGATVTLHGIRSVPPAAGDHRRAQESRHFYILDVTVKPRRDRWGPERWTPGDLSLVAPGALPAWPEEDLEVGRIFHAERWHRDQFVEVYGGPLCGPQRLRLHVGLIPSERRFHFRDYLELLRRHPAI